MNRDISVTGILSNQYSSGKLVVVRIELGVKVIDQEIICPKIMLLGNDILNLRSLERIKYKFIILAGGTRLN